MINKPDRRSTFLPQDRHSKMGILALLNCTNTLNVKAVQIPEVKFLSIVNGVEERDPSSAV